MEKRDKIELVIEQLEERIAPVCPSPWQQWVGQRRGGYERRQRLRSTADSKYGDGSRRQSERRHAELHNALDWGQRAGGQPPARSRRGARGSAWRYPSMQ